MLPQTTNIVSYRCKSCKRLRMAVPGKQRGQYSLERCACKGIAVCTECGKAACGCGDWERIGDHS